MKTPTEFVQKIRTSATNAAMLAASFDALLTELCAAAGVTDPASLTADLMTQVLHPAFITVVDGVESQRTDMPFTEQDAVLAILAMRDLAIAAQSQKYLLAKVSG